MTFLRFSRIDRATKTATVAADDFVLSGAVSVFAQGRVGAVGEARADGDTIELKLNDPSAWRMVIEKVYLGAEAASHAIVMGGRAAGRALQSLLLVDRPDFLKGTPMFTKSFAAPRAPYRLEDVMQGTQPRRGPLSLGEFGKLSRLDRAATPQAASDAARLYDPSVSPSLRAAVIHSAMLTSNNVADPNIQALRDQIAALVDNGAITMSIAGALLRSIDPTRPSDSGTYETNSPSLSDRSNGASGLPNGYYPATSPAGGGAKAAFAELRRHLRR